MSESTSLCSSHQNRVQVMLESLMSRQSHPDRVPVAQILPKTPGSCPNHGGHDQVTKVVSESPIFRLKRSSACHQNLIKITKSCRVLTSCQSPRVTHVRIAKVPELNQILSEPKKSHLKSQKTCLSHPGQVHLTQIISESHHAQVGVTNSYI